MSSLSPSSSQRSGHIYINVRKQSGDITTKLFTTKKEIDKALENGSLAKFLPKWLAVPTGQKSQGQHMQQFIKATKGFIENKSWHLLINTDDLAPQASIDRRCKLSVNHQFHFLPRDQNKPSLVAIQKYVLEQIERFREGSEAPTLNPVNRNVSVTRPSLTDKEEALIKTYVAPKGSKKQNKAKRNQELRPSIEEVREELERTLELDIHPRQIK
jgi:hypothetical protein